MHCGVHAARSRLNEPSARSRLGKARQNAWHAAYLPRSGCCRRRHLDDQVVLFDRNRKRLCDVRPLDEARASFDRHLELPRPYRFGIAPRLTRADVVFPAMPGAAQEFLLARQTVTTRAVRQDERADPSTAQWAAGVWAAIGQREILAVEIENADLTPPHAHDLAGPGRDVARPGDDLATHFRPYSALALSRNTSALFSSATLNLNTCCGSSKSQCG